MKVSKLSKTEYNLAQELLKKVRLPFEDIYSENISLFELIHDNETIAIGGFEFYENDAIIRSIAVIPEKQLKGTGTFLVNALEDIAIKEGVKKFYLLTTTAEKFFKKKGYNLIDRKLVPESIKSSAEFKSICPDTATCMTKDLTKKYVPIILEVDSEIKLKQIELSDAKDVFATIDTQRKYLGEWLPFVAYTHSVENPIKYIQTTLQASKEKCKYVFVIKYINTFAGIIGFKDSDIANKKIEIGYWLSESLQKKGIMRRCVNKILDFGFNDLEFNRIQIKCAVGNKKSVNIPKFFNFKFEGIERAGELFPIDNFVDLEIYSLLKHEHHSF